MLGKTLFASTLLFFSPSLAEASSGSASSAADQSAAGPAASGAQAPAAADPAAPMRVDLLPTPRRKGWVNAPVRVMWRLGVTRPRSAKPLACNRSSCSPDKAVREIGTSSGRSGRRWAVTTIAAGSSALDSAAFPDAVARPLPTSARRNATGVMNSRMLDRLSADAAPRPSRINLHYTREASDSHRTKTWRGAAS